jgi:hypothetical protein
VTSEEYVATNFSQGRRDKRDLDKTRSVLPISDHSYSGVQKKCLVTSTSAGPCDYFTRDLSENGPGIRVVNGHLWRQKTQFGIGQMEKIQVRANIILFVLILSKAEEEKKFICSS